LKVGKATELPTIKLVGVPEKSATGAGGTVTVI